MKPGFLLALSWLVLFGCARVPPDRSGVAPNVIFVILDAARADHFSGYGYHLPTTPEIDGIGERGAVFLNSFVPETETFAVMPLIMSSRYYSRPIFQMDTWKWGIRRETPDTLFRDFDDEQILLPELLGRAGWRTAIFHNHPWFVDQTELVRAFHEAYRFPPAVREPVDGQMVGAVISWIESNRNGPFFIYYHVMSPHQPFPEQAEDARFIGPGQEKALAAAREKFKGPGGGEAGNWSEDELYYFRVMYDSNLAHSDRRIGELYSALEALGLAEDTIFIVSSDHGELLGEHGRLTHGDYPPWEGIIRVPLVMAWPGRIPAGVRASGLVEAVDIFPTIIDLAGIELPAGKSLDGSSLKPMFRDPDAGREAVYVKNAVRTGEYKYMIGRGLFFDLIEDPGETVDISERVPPELKAQLKRDYERFKAPYRERYLGAVRKAPPEYPFYYPFNAFVITPAVGYRYFASERPPSRVLGDLESGRAWHLNASDRQGYLICRPAEESPPRLSLSAPMIDGTYRILLPVEPLESGLGDLPGKEFRARFDPAGDLLPPVEVIKYPGEEDEGATFSLDYGTVEVRDRRFTLEIDFQPSSTAAFLIHHVRFEPPAGPDPGPAAPAELEERIRSLRSLGYIQ